MTLGAWLQAAATVLGLNSAALNLLSAVGSMLSGLATLAAVVVSIGVAIVATNDARRANSELKRYQSRLDATDARRDADLRAQELARHQAAHVTVGCQWGEKDPQSSTRTFNWTVRMARGSEIVLTSARRIQPSMTSRERPAALDLLTTLGRRSVRLQEPQRTYQSTVLLDTTTSQSEPLLEVEFVDEMSNKWRLRADSSLLLVAPRRISSEEVPNA